MNEYTYDELVYKVDVILSNIVDGRDIKFLCDRFDTWLSLEFTSGSINAVHFEAIRLYAHEQIEILTNTGMY